MRRRIEPSRVAITVLLAAGVILAVGCADAVSPARDAGRGGAGSGGGGQLDSGGGGAGGGGAAGTDGGDSAAADGKAGAGGGGGGGGAGGGGGGAGGGAAPDAGGAEAGAADCLPKCIADRIKDCVGSGTCTSATIPSGQNRCWSNGVKSSSTTAGGVRETVFTKADGKSVCYRVVFSSGAGMAGAVATFSDGTGMVFATGALGAGGAVVGGKWTVICDGMTTEGDLLAPACIERVMPGASSSAGSSSCAPGTCTYP